MRYGRENDLRVSCFIESRDSLCDAKIEAKR
jgi:hypothetical protein